MTTASVVLWGRDIAAVTWDETRDIGVFQYQPEFVNNLNFLLSPKQHSKDFPGSSLTRFQISLVTP